METPAARLIPGGRGFLFPAIFLQSLLTAHSFFGADRFNRIPNTQFINPTINSIACYIILAFHCILSWPNL